MAYGDKAFLEIIEEEGIGYNNIIFTLRDS
jgi:hypothetical protein